MAQRSKLWIAGALTIVLSLSGAAQAGAAPRREPVNTWRWVASLWTGGVAGVLARLAGVESDLEKAGAGVDPNGQEIADPCDTCTDAGPGIDPNG